jgi:hypothetical protein
MVRVSVTVFMDTEMSERGRDVVRDHTTTVRTVLNRRPMYEYRCDERLKVKSEGSTCRNILSKVATLRTSLSLGVPVPHTTQCIRDMCVVTLL